jgi:hypothetical protein
MLRPIFEKLLSEASSTRQEFNLYVWPLAIAIPSEKVAFQHLENLVQIRCIWPVESPIVP